MKLLKGDRTAVEIGNLIEGMTIVHWADALRQDVALNKLRTLMLQNPDQKPRAEFLRKEA